MTSDDTAPSRSTAPPPQGPHGTSSAGASAPRQAAPGRAQGGAWVASPSATSSPSGGVALTPSGRTPPPSAGSLPPGARIEQRGAEAALAIEALYAGRGEDGAALPPVEELLRWLEREIACSQDPRETAELRVRAALLAWDGRGLATRALQLISDVDHPVATALRLQAAIDAPDSGELLRFAEEVQHRGDLEEVAEVGELLLWRGEYVSAAALLERATGGPLLADAASDSVRPTQERARQLRALALVLADRAAEAIDALSLAVDGPALLLASQLAEDLLGDVERARTLLRRLLDKPQGLSTRDHARALERLYDLEARRPIESGRTELLRRKLEVLGGVRRLVSALEDPEPLHVEIFLTALLLAQSLERGGSAQALSESVSLLAAVSRYCQDQREGAAHLPLHAALRTRARVEAARQSYAEAATALDELALRCEALATRPQRRGEPLTPEVVLAPQLLAWAQAYGRRAAELWEARVEHGALQARASYERLFQQDPSDSALALALVRLLLRQGAASDAAAVLDRHASAVGQEAPAELLRAARAAEAVRDSRVVERWLDALPTERLALEALARLQRRRADRPRLCQSYRQLGASAGAGGVTSAGSPDVRRRACYLSVAAALALEALPSRDAEALLGEALVSGGDRGGELHGGLLALLCRVLLLQRQGRHTELALAVQELLPRVRANETLASLHLILARTATEHLGDLELARRSYQHVLSLRPGDVVALHALSRFSAERAVDQAAALLRQAVEQALKGTSPVTMLSAPPELSGTGPRAAAVLLCELGDLYARPGPDQDEAQALTHYDEAARLDPECRPALRALCTLHRAARRFTEELAALTRLLPLCRDEQERLPLLLRVGACCEAQAGTDGTGSSTSHSGPLLAFAAAAAEQALNAYSECLRLDPKDPTALERLDKLCRRLGRWDLLVGALDPVLALASGAQRTRVLRALCDAAERLERWTEVVRYREEELTQLSEPREVLRAARALAEIYEHRLQQPEAAARVWERAYQASPNESLAMAAVPAALERLYTAQGRHRELLTLLGGELARIEAQEREAAAAPEGASDVTDPGLASTRSGVASLPLRELRERRRELLLRQAALRAEHLRDPEGAAELYERVLGEWPEDPPALAALSTLYADQGRLDELRQVLEQRARGASDPVEQAKILVQLGELLERGAADELPRAQEVYKDAFNLDPGSRAAFTALERVCYRREDWPEALRMYDTALRLVEQQRSRAYRLGDLYARRGQVLLQYLNRPSDAAACYLKALEYDADNDANQAALERIYAQAAAERAAVAAGQDKASAAPERITTTQPAISATEPPQGTGGSVSASGGASQERSGAAGEWAALIAAYERRATLVRDDGKRVEILRRGARVAAAKLRDIPEAIRLYQKLHAVDPTDSEALDALERHYERSRDHERLIALLGTRLALSTTESESIALNLRIALLCEEGLRDHNRAIDAFRQVLEVSPNHREALEAMGRLFEATERWAELVEATRRQIRLTGDRTQKALLYFKCGSVMEAKFGKEDDAIRYYEAAVKTSPSCLPAVHGLRDIYLRRTDWPKVTQTLELEAKLWTEDKERAGIYAHIGQIYRDELRDLDRAIQYYESALAVDRECLPANRALFEVYYERGDWPRAVPISQVLSVKVNREGDPAERSAFYLKRAVVGEHTGDLRTAAESLVVALEIQPENMEALEHLVALCRRDVTVYDFASTFRELEKLYRRRAGLSNTGGARSTQSVAALDVGSLLRGADSSIKGLGLSLVARAVLAERAYEIEVAEELLAEAVRLSPLDFSVMEALLGLHERLRHFPAAREALTAFLGRLDLVPRSERTLLLRTRAQLRLAEMYSDAAMESEEAVAVLRALVDELAQADADVARSPAEGPPRPPAELWRKARFLLAQELYLVGRYPEARATIEALIDHAVRPAQPGGAVGTLAPPEELARYYDYLGRIQEAAGDGAAAQRHYRRAVDLDHAFALPVLALARRAVSAGDRAQAEVLVREALGQAARRGDPREELLLMRGVARLLAPVDANGAAAAYRRAIQYATAQLDAEARLAATLGHGSGAAPVVARETLDDRVALADLLLQQGEGTTVAAAAEELQVVLQRDLRHAPAYRLLAEAYDRLGERERAGRVLAALSLLGYAEGAAPPHSFYRPSPRRGTINDEVRQARLLLPAFTSPYMELLAAVGEALTQAFPAPWPPPGGPTADDSAPAARLGDAALKLAISEVQRLLACPDVEVLVAQKVPGGVLALESYGGRPTVVMEAALLERSEGERRFLLGRAMEPLRGGYASLLRLRAAEQREVERLLDNLLRPEAERDATAQDFVRNLPRRAYRVVERLTGTVPKLTVSAFFAALPLCADRAGLLCCDDITAATRMMARLQGEELALVDSISGGAVLLGQVIGGAELVRFFLSDSYHEVRATLRDASHL